MRRAVRGFGWIFALRMATRITGVASTFVLVRLLAPADFGLVALSSTFLEIIDAFSALGVEEAMVRTIWILRSTEGVRKPSRKRHPITWRMRCPV